MRDRGFILLLKNRRLAADTLPFEVHGHFHAISNLYEWDVAIHTIVFAVEGHGPTNRP